MIARSNIFFAAVLFSAVLLFAGSISWATTLTPDAQLAPASRQRPIIIFSCSISAASPNFNLVKGLYRDVFERLNYDFDMVALPAARENIELPAGNYDGTCGRSDNPAFIEAGLIKIEPPLSRLMLQLIAINAAPHIKTMADIAPDSTVAYIRGSSSAASTLKKQPHIKSYMLTTHDSALKMLAANRIDFYLHSSMEKGDVYFEPKVNRHLHVVLSWEAHRLYPYLQAKHKKIQAEFQAELTRQLQRYPDGIMTIPVAHQDLSRVR